MRGDRRRSRTRACVEGATRTAELLRHRLHAVADAEHGNAELEHDSRRTRRLRIRDRLGTAGQDDALRLEGADFVVRDVPGQDLAVHAHFAHAPRDELRVLRAEIENQDPVGVDVRMRYWRKPSDAPRFAYLTHDTR